ncbi:uncharacterized protein knl1 isoform X3 [Synchiropus splendidus]|uniref:uncharacterized protein knl1 isoform X3 n=1 Tax=Synchiropus splendidus TaxID=270530 RepID=UPI00237E7C4E|nr:uncharacterized protein knl1 isoform X3 [Synchiropus splendidus]
MDPMDVGRNDENGGVSKRRISSILKAPRKSAICPDPVQQEYTMEPCKPAEKRISRRVSFAPANDVLLFSKDLKNSPGRSPLQELMATTAPTPQNSRAQVVGTEEAHQQIKGMETLLSGSLHHSRHPEKSTTEGLGERTMIYSSDDAFMDMTHSHTINIAHVEDTFLDPPHGSKPTFRATSSDFTLAQTPNLRASVGVNMDFCASPSLPEFDSDFRDFLSSLSKPSGPNVVPHMTPAAATSQVKDVSKENRAPLVVSGSVPPAQQQDSSFGKAEEEDEPFGFLFPPKERLKAQRESVSEKTAPPKSHSEYGATRSTEVTSLRKSSTPAPGLSSKTDRALGLTPNHAAPASWSVDSALSTLSTSSDTRTPAKLLQAVDPSSALNSTRAAEDAHDDDDGDLSMDLTEAHTGYISDATLHLLPQPTGGKTAVNVLMETGVCMSVCEEALKNEGKEEPRGHAADLTSLLSQQSQTGAELPTGALVKEVEMEMTECLTMNVETDLFLHSLLNKDGVQDHGPGRAVRASQETLWDQDVSMALTVPQAGGITELEHMPRRSLGVRHAPVGRQSGAAGELLCKDWQSSVEPSRPAAAEQKTSADDREGTVRFSAEDVCMDETRSHTAIITADLQNQNREPSASVGEKTIQFNWSEAHMDLTTSHTAHLDLAPTEKTVRFSANAGAMDTTQCLTTRIDVALRKGSQFGGERTVRFCAEDAAMEMTRSHTASIASHLPHLSVPLGPCAGEKTVRFNTNGAEMDLTKSHTVHIHDYLAPQKRQSRELLLPGGEKTIRFQAQDADMDLTRCCTMNVAACLGREAQQNLNFWSGDKTVRFQDAAMDVTKNHTVWIEAQQDLNWRPSDPEPSDRAVGLQSSGAAMDVANIAAELEPGCEELSAGGAEKTLRFQDAAMDMTKNHTVWIEAQQDLNWRPSDPEASDRAVGLQSCGAAMDVTNIVAELEPGSEELSAGGAEKTLRFQDTAMDMTRNHTVNILASEDEAATRSGSAVLASHVEPQSHQSTLQEPSQPSPEASNSSSSQGQVSGSRSLSALHSGTGRDIVRGQRPSGRWCHAPAEPPELDVSDAHGAVETTTHGSTADGEKDPDELQSGGTVLKSSCQDDDEVSPPARKSRRMSLTDLQSKVRRLSHLISTAPRCPPVPDLDPDDRCEDKHPEDGPEDEDGSQARTEEPRLNPVTPLNLRSNALMSRLSVGSIKPKLPSRGKALDERPSVDLASEGRLHPLDRDVSYIKDEELGSYEEVSETLDMSSPPRAPEMSSPPEIYGWDLDPDLDLDALADLAFAPHRKKRGSLPDAGAAEETRPKPEVDAMDARAVSQAAGSSPPAPSVAPQPVDTCEATFETTLDCTSDVSKKLENPCITVSHFLKLFNIDFVIHKPRQSVPGNQQRSEDSTEMQLLKDRHLLLPRQRVYEREERRLAERLEELKVRKEDLGRPLRMVNPGLWTEMKTLSEPELQGFGVKLKERHRFFSKLSKEMFHQKKEALYMELLQAQEEQDVVVRRSLAEAEQVLGGLDQCVAQVQAELAALDRTSSGSLQEELQSLERSLEQKSRLQCEAETCRARSASTMERLKVEAHTLHSQLELLHQLSEWRMELRPAGRTLFTFLHGTLQLEVTHQDGEEEEKLADISATLQLDEERSQDHARLVHLLLSQHLQTQTRSWLDRYPTRAHVPKLLLDLGLVVSRCRLLGEELRLLRAWGALRLDILDICCRQGRVHILFSSLKTFSKFEVVLSASVVDGVCMLQLFSFRNLIGRTSLSQVSQIVASASPGRKLLTRIVKKIHQDLLS